MNLVQSQRENHLGLSISCSVSSLFASFSHFFFFALYTHFIIIINKLHLHKVHFRPQIEGASRGGWR